MNLSLRQVTKRFGDHLALHHVSLEIADREFFCLLGPSGCGKTTLLRLLAGFHETDEGELLFADRQMTKVLPHERSVAMVSQNPALWPHLTLAQNVAYGLKVRGLDSAGRERQTREVLELVRLGPYADRFPGELSGGERQRAALARALVVRPELLLLDEPLSGLDAPLRAQLRDEIRRLHKACRVTTVYVTHDQDEVLSLADRVAVMREGGIEQVAGPREVYRRPATRFVGDLLGPVNWLEGTVESVAGRGLWAKTRLGNFRVEETFQTHSPGAQVWVGFRPMTVQFAPIGENEIRCRIEAIDFRGAMHEYSMVAGENILFTAFERSSASQCHLGFELTVSIPPGDLLVVPR